MPSTPPLEPVLYAKPLAIEIGAVVPSKIVRAKLANILAVQLTEMSLFHPLWHVAMQKNRMCLVCRAEMAPPEMSSRITVNSSTPERRRNEFDQR